MSALEVGVEEAVDAGDDEREGGAGGARLERGGARPRSGRSPASSSQAASEGPRSRGAGARRSRLGGAEGESVEGAEEALVVGGRRPGRGAAPAMPATAASGDALGARQAQVEVHVVAVGGVDVVAQPDAGVGDPQAGGGEGGGDRRRSGRGRGRRSASRASGASSIESRSSSGSARRASWLPGTRTTSTSPTAAPSSAKNGQGAVERRAERAFAQLDDVAEQDQALGAAQLLEQDGADLGVAQDVAAAGRRRGAGRR